MNTILTQFAGWGSVAVSMVLGLIFIVHGWGKVKNPSGMASFWWGSKTLALLHGAAEIAAGLAVALGIYTQWGAAFMVVVMVGAIYYKAFIWKTGFRSEKTTGWEFDLILLAAALALILG